MEGGGTCFAATHCCRIPSNTSERLCDNSATQGEKMAHLEPQTWDWQCTVILTITRIAGCSTSASFTTWGVSVAAGEATTHASQQQAKFSDRGTNASCDARTITAGRLICMHAHTSTHIRIYVDPHTQSLVHTQARNTYMSVHTNARTNTQHAHTRTHISICTNTCKHTKPRVWRTACKHGTIPPPNRRNSSGTYLVRAMTRRPALP